MSEDERPISTFNVQRRSRLSQMFAAETQRISIWVTSVVVFNSGYLLQWAGVFKLCHLVLGIITASVSGHYLTQNSGTAESWESILFSPEIYFFLITSFCVIVTTLLLITYLISIDSANLMAKTIFETIFYGVATLLLISASAAYISRIDTKNEKPFIENPSLGYGGRMAISVLGFLNGILYDAACFCAWKDFSKGNERRESETQIVY